MKQWELVDCLEPLDEDEDHPRIPIRSEGQLRQELLRMQQRVRNGLAAVHAPDMGGLSFSLGGPFGSLGWHPPLAENRLKGSKEALPQRCVAQQPVRCWAEGMPTDIGPQDLFPVEEVIEAIIHFYNHHELPQWITWREWNPATKAWDIHPARSAQRPLPAPAKTAG